MAENKKSVIEEVLAEFDLIEETLNSNAKEILRSVAKEEINSTLNESLYEDDYDIEDIEDVDSDVDALPVDDAPDATPDFGGEEGGSEELGLDDIGVDSGEEDLGLDSEEGSEDYGIDMTDASDEEVISVYKKLQGDDEIEVVSSDEVIIKDPVSGAEYNVKMNGGGGESLIDQGELSVDDEPEIGLEPEAEPEIGPEIEEPEEEESEAPEFEAEPETEIGGEEEETEDEEEDTEDDDDLGEAVVYEIELSEEDDEITEGIENDPKINKDSKIGATADGKPRTATSDRTSGKDTGAPNTGDIEGQNAPEDSDSGDNLEGGFTEKHNGKGGNHASHVMEGEEDVNEDTEEVTETQEFPTSSPEALPAEEKTAKAKGNAHATHVMETEEEVSESTEEVNEDEEVVEETEELDEYHAKNAVQQRAAGGGLTDIKGPGAKQQANFQKRYAETVQRYNALLAEAKELKKENETFKTALKDFRKTITETAVFNINLTHATKLFLEHSTTSEEKKNILTRFDDEVTTIEESKKLYKQINSELGRKDTITESIENKLESAQQTSGQAQQILENKKLNQTVAYVDPAQQRVLDLIKRTR